MTEDPEVSGGSPESVASLKLGDKVQIAKVKVQATCGSKYKDHARKTYKIYVEPLTSVLSKIKYMPLLSFEERLFDRDSVN